MASKCSVCCRDALCIEQTRAKRNEQAEEADQTGKLQDELLLFKEEAQRSIEEQAELAEFIKVELLVAREEAEQSGKQLVEQANQISKLQKDLLLVREEAERWSNELDAERKARGALQQVAFNSSNFKLLARRHLKSG